MKRYPVFIVDAFTQKPFGGNPAAVVLLVEDIPDGEKQQIAAEMNLSETAFIKPKSTEFTANPFQSLDQFDLRWFTPTTEVPLCGHATLATASVLFSEMSNVNNKLSFHTKSSGILEVEITDRDRLMMEMKLPLNNPHITITPADSAIWSLIPLVVGTDLAGRVIEVALSPTTRKLVICLDLQSIHELENMLPPNKDDLTNVRTEDRVRGVIVTTKVGTKYDFVSRYFAPWVGIPEDPVTGSAHTVLGPFWRKKLGKVDMFAKQCSPRGGEVVVHVDETNQCTRLEGSAKIILKGELTL